MWFWVSVSLSENRLTEIRKSVFRRGANRLDDPIHPAVVFHDYPLKNVQNKRYGRKKWTSTWSQYLISLPFHSVNDSRNQKWFLRISWSNAFSTDTVGIIFIGIFFSRILYCVFATSHFKNFELIFFNSVWRRSSSSSASRSRISFILHVLIVSGIEMF